MAAVLLAVYCAGLAYVLLSPSAAFSTDSVSRVAIGIRGLGIPDTVATGARVEFLCNVLIIVPISLLGSLIRPSWTWRDWLALGFVLSGAVELGQALFLPDRSAQFADLVANTLGAGLGAVVAALVRRRLVAGSTSEA